jgi:hypothetical protein
MKSVAHASDNTFSALGLDLKKRIAIQVKFFESMSPMAMKAISIEGQSDSMPSMDDFLCNFNHLYLTSEAFRGNLMVGLMSAFVTKSEGKRVLNFMLALSASGDRKAFQFVSENLCLVSVRHIACITSQKRSATFINLEEDEMVFRIKEHIWMIRIQCVEAGLSERVAFTAGFDGTVLAKSFQIHYSSNGNVVVGGVYPNHFLPLPEINSDDGDGETVSKFLGKCVNGNKWEAASEIKVCVLSFQCTPPGTTPYYTLVGRPQTINEQSIFGSKVVKACLRATIEDGNAILLNTTTDGVSTEVQWNLLVMLDYINGKINYVSLPDNNHNVKNSRYQFIGGSSLVSIGAYVFDPALIRLSKVNQKLWRVEDFASNAVVLKLASVDTIQKLHMLALQDRINCDVGNHAVTVISHLFLRLWVYAVNSRMVPWRDQAVYSWVTLVWFTSLSS